MRLQDFYRGNIAVKVFFYTAGLIKDRRNKIKNRFKKIYSQGALTCTEILVDRETGVNYIYHSAGYSGGLTVLLDRDGKPVITPVIDLED